MGIQDPILIKNPKMFHYEDEIDAKTKWWDSYPVKKYKHLTKPKEAFKSYISDVFGKPKQLMRSASCVNLTFIKDADVSFNYPLHKSPSFSALAPSHALYPGDRYATRHISSAQAYKPAMDAWHQRYYSPRQYIESRSFRAKKGYIPSYDSPWRRPLDPVSYWDGSQHYMNRYIVDRGRVSAGEAYYQYRTHDQQVNHRWTRFPAPHYGVFVGTSTSVPKMYRPAWHSFRIYSLRHRHNFNF